MMLSTQHNYQRIRAVLHWILIQSLLPISVTYVMSVWLARFFFSAKLQNANKIQESQETVESKTPANDVDVNVDVDVDADGRRRFSVVLTGGKMSKTLHMVRCLRSYADSDPLVDLTITVLEQAKFRYCNTRFSRCVDHFQVITSPRVSPDAYMQGIYDACLQHGATHFLPVAAPVEAVYDAQIKTRLEKELHVNVLHMDSALCEILDDKHRFGCFLRDTLGLRSPRTHQVICNEQVHQYNENFAKEVKEGTLKRTMILKNLQYDPIHRLDLFQLPVSKEKLDAYLRKIEADGNPITADEPWQLQEFLAGGIEYAAMIVVRSNKVVTMTCCPSSASQLNYIHVEIPAIRTWLNDFMKGLQQSEYVLTGQLCFDFMVLQETQPDGSVVDVAYPIECNPRVHTQCTIYNRDDVRAVFGSLLLDARPEKEQQLLQLLDRDYSHPQEEAAKKKGNSNNNDADMLNVFWFYNEFFKIFPNSWLLSYNGDKDDLDRTEMLSSYYKPTGDEQQPQLSAWHVFVLCMYLPSILLSVVLALPVLISLLVVQSKKAKSSLTMTQHATAMWILFVRFVDRLVHVNNNSEGDLWWKDTIPFLAKNHVQVPSRLLATIRTGVEWKKIDFAIGKVVEVGGD